MPPSAFTCSTKASIPSLYGVPTSPVAPDRSAMTPIGIGSSESALAAPPPPHAARVMAATAARAARERWRECFIAVSLCGEGRVRPSGGGVGRDVGSIAEGPEAEPVLDALPDPVEAARLEDEEDDDREAEDPVLHGRELVLDDRHRTAHHVRDAAD